MCQLVLELLHSTQHLEEKLRWTKVETDSAALQLVSVNKRQLDVLFECLGGGVHGTMIGLPSGLNTGPSSDKSNSLRLSPGESQLEPSSLPPYMV